MDDKFVLVGLDDDKSKDIAEVLSNKTCKKILDFLADNAEMSEQDISKSLDIPLNTVEYNLKKLIKAGLVEKAKNFFWSVKGKKIPTYKLVKKHIIISHKSSKPSMSVLRALLPVLAVLAIVAIMVAVIPQGDGPAIIGDNLELKQFESYSEMKNYIKENAESSGSGGIFGGFGKGAIMEASSGATTGAASVDQAVATDYSETNIQVEGVDEPDIVKNDGEFIYVVSGNKVVIVDAYPAEAMTILSEIEFKEGVRDIFINDNKLVVFGGSYYGQSQKTFVYDISDKANPELENEIKLDGQYTDSRMIGDYVYVISTKYVQPNSPEPPVFVVGGVERAIAPQEIYYFPHEDSSYVFTSVIAINVESGEFDSETYLTGGSREVYVSENNIYLVRTEYMSYDTRFEQTVNEVYLEILLSREAGKIEDIMDSDKSIYLKSNEIEKIVRDYSNSLDGDDRADFDKELLEKLEELEVDLQKRYEKTEISKIGVDGFDIDYQGSGKVPGRVLNQFSMDEYRGNFRIATTTGQVSRSGGGSLNHLYILDEDLEIVGSVEDLAEGESIYSVRFMGKRAYIVTFKKVDPLFVIDVSNPRDPEVLGYLKITGYSDYLHPYDEDHIIGVGKEAIAAEQGDFAWYQGVKISLFDVSDVDNPIEKAKIEIGDRGTDSYALNDHHAFLFDKERGLLVIPISLSEIDESKYSGDIPDNAYGERTWSGAYVLNIDENDISIRGKISHDDNTLMPASEEEIGAGRIDRNGNIYVKVDEKTWETDAYDEGTYYAQRTNSQVDLFPGGRGSTDYTKQIQRSLFMDDYLYTISQGKVKANDLETVDEISEVDLGYENPYDGRYAIYE